VANWVNVAGKNINLDAASSFEVGKMKSGKTEIFLYFGQSENIRLEGAYAEALVKILEPLVKPIGPEDPPPKPRRRLGIV
jgi:hypothetical protein